MENIELLKLFEIVNNWDFPREFTGDDLLVYAFIFIFLGSAMYSIYKLLDRRNLAENLMLMVVPYLLLLVFIVPHLRFWTGSAAARIPSLTQSAIPVFIFSVVYSY